MTLEEFSKALNDIEQNIANTFSGLGCTAMETQAASIREDTRRKAKEMQDALAGWCDKCHANLAAQARATGNNDAFCNGRSWFCPVFAAAAHTQQILDDCEKWEKVSNRDAKIEKQEEEKQAGKESSND